MPIQAWSKKLYAVGSKAAPSLGGVDDGVRLIEPHGAEAWTVAAVSATGVG